jgi:hypothetical protein
MPLFDEEEGAWSEDGDEGFEGDRLVIRGIYIDDVKDGGLFGKERKGAGGIKGDEGSSGDVEGGDVLFDAGDGVAVLLHKGGLGGATADGFKRHGTAAGIEIEKAGVGNVILANVEDSFAEHPLRRTGGGAFRSFKGAAFVNACNNSECHLNNIPFLKSGCKSAIAKMPKNIYDFLNETVTELPSFSIVPVFRK